MTQIERYLNRACIILIIVTFVFICMNIGKAYRMAHDTTTNYEKPAPRIIEGKYTVIEGEAKPVSP